MMISPSYRERRVREADPVVACERTRFGFGGCVVEVNTRDGGCLCWCSPWRRTGSVGTVFPVWSVSSVSFCP